MDRPLQTFRIVPFVGIETPTGDDDETGDSSQNEKCKNAVQDWRGGVILITHNTNNHQSNHDNPRRPNLAFLGQALIAPSLVELGILPIAAHMFVMYLGMMSFLTPPVAIAAYFAASMADAPPMATGWTCMRFG